MGDSMIRTLAFATLFFSFLLVPNDTSLLAQNKKPQVEPTPADSDSTSLIPSAMEDCPIKLPIGTNNLQVEMKVQYTVQGQTIFILPAYVAGKVERVIEGKMTPLKPGDRLLPVEEKRLVRLRITVNNMLDNLEHEKAIVDQIKKRVLDQLGLDPSAKFQIKRPIIKTEGIRFSLITAGLGNEFSPAEVAIANPVARPLDGVLTFNLDPVVIRKIEKDKELANGLLCSALEVLPTGQMKVKFERLEMDAQVSYLKATIDDFRKRVGSMVNSATNQSPDVIIPLGNSGNAEIKNQLSSMLRQSLQVTVSKRQGTDLPLMPFLEKAVDSMLESSKLDMQNDQQRVSFLLENQVTITSTLGEIKRLSKLDEKQRSNLIKEASDHYYSTRKEQKSNYTGGLNVGYLGYSVGVTGGAENTKLEETDMQIKEEKEQQKKAFDKLVQEFDAKVPTLSGIQIDDTSLTSSTKQMEIRFQQNSFKVDYTLQRFTPVSLSGATDANISFTEMIRQYSILKSDYDALQKAVGTPTQLAEAKENIKRLEGLAEELKQKSATLDAALSTFEKTSKELLAKVDQDAVIKLQKEVVKLKALVNHQYSNIEAAFKTLDKDERPPGLDCLGLSIKDNTVVAAQEAWARFLDQKSHLDSVSITKDGEVKLEMVLIPAGKFIMGSPEEEKDRADDEDQHEVTITKPFYMGKYEVTQEQWESVMGSNPSSDKGAKLPVTEVSWNDCQEFIKKLNEKTKGGFRLPTEAEWEYACRAGTTTAYSFGDTINPQDANYDGSGIFKPVAVGSYKANAFGLYDMHGNVWEWCEDWYGWFSHAVPLLNFHGNVWEWCEDWYGKYSKGPVTNPKGLDSGSYRVLRGGSFLAYARYSRSADRDNLSPDNRIFNDGFRLARTP